MKSSAARKTMIFIIIAAELTVLLILLFSFRLPAKNTLSSGTHTSTSSDAKKDYIHWVEFHVTAEALNRAFRYDVDTLKETPHLNWIELLAWLGAKYGGDFSHYRSYDMDQLVSLLKNGETMEKLTENMDYYSYYLEAYSAILSGMVGTYEIEIPASSAPSFALEQKNIQSPHAVSGCNTYLPSASVLPKDVKIPEKVWVKKYGLKAFFPLASGYPYSDFDDFGTARSYGYKRQHLGHDYLGQTGTPVIAVEGGHVEALGWNQYGGWRIGIRSFDKKRYYYYAHLRQNYPYHKSLKENAVVEAGDVIGYLGHTGYSRKENVNNIEEPHLHFGMQLIFDESQKDGNNEIWIDCYELSKFLAMHKSETVKNQETKEYNRIFSLYAKE